MCFHIHYSLLAELGPEPKSLDSLPEHLPLGSVIWLSASSVHSTGGLKNVTCPTRNLQVPPENIHTAYLSAKEILKASCSFPVCLLSHMYEQRENV